MNSTQKECLETVDSASYEIFASLLFCFSKYLCLMCFLNLHMEEKCTLVTVSLETETSGHRRYVSFQQEL